VRSVGRPIPREAALSPDLPGERVKHPRLWALVLVGASILPILLGRGLTGCFITANGECFQAYDATIGYSLLITGGLLILAALMVLTGGVAAKRRRFKAARGVRIPNSAKRHLNLQGYWALALLTVTTTATAMAFVLPWWQVRGTDGSSSTLYYSRWCNDGGGPPFAGCFPYSAFGFGPLPGDIVFAFLMLQILVAASVICLAFATVGLALPRMQARAPRLLAVVSFMGVALASVTVIDAVFTIPRLEPYLTDPASGFSGLGGVSGYLNYAWGPAAAWYLLFLAAETGWLGLIAKRAAFRSERALGMAR
jgi:hypothetical protein